MQNINTKYSIIKFKFCTVQLVFKFIKVDIHYLKNLKKSLFQPMGIAVAL